MRTVNGRAGLVILSAPGAELEARIVKGQEDPPQGWVPAGWGEHRPSPVAIYSAEEELPLAVDMVLYPHPGEDAPALAVERLDVQEEGERVPAWQASALCVHVDGGRDYYLVSHERRALRTAGPLVSDAELVLVRCGSDGRPGQLALINGSYVSLDGRLLVAAEETFPRLELSWEGDALTVDAGHPVGADLWAGGAGRLIIGEGEARAIQPVDDRIAIFEDWLD